MNEVKAPSRTRSRTRISYDEDQDDDVEEESPIIRRSRNRITSYDESPTTEESESEDGKTQSDDDEDDLMDEDELKDHIEGLGSRSERQKKKIFEELRNLAKDEVLVKLSEMKETFDEEEEEFEVKTTRPKRNTRPPKRFHSTDNDCGDSAESDHFKENRRPMRKRTRMSYELSEGDYHDDNAMMEEEQRPKRQRKRPERFSEENDSNSVSNSSRRSRDMVKPKYNYSDDEDEDDELDDTPRMRSLQGRQSHRQLRQKVQNYRDSDSESDFEP